jgi:hypothetical protein
VQSREQHSERSIAVWGAPASGKTTFLAALQIALAKQEPDWQVIGADAESEQGLVRLTDLLAAGGTFPLATGDIQHYRWALVGPVQRDGRRWWFGRTRQGENIKIELDLIDAPGSMAVPGSQVQGNLIENLAKSRAIVFLYDPIREFETGDVFHNTSAVLTELSQRISVPDGKLPHYVAVCITKFDEVRVHAAAEKLDLLVRDPEPPGFPRVANEHAREFFLELSNVSRTGEARLIPKLLERIFHPDRIRYFVTSAIGFYVDPETGTYRPEDFQNHIPGPQGSRIRGSIRPINVVEPLLWLSERMAAQAESTKAEELSYSVQKGSTRHGRAFSGGVGRC